MTIKKIIKLLVLYLTIFLLHESSANIIIVPADQPTIQAAINVVSSSDTILVATGRYYENIKLENKKNIVIGSYFLTTGDTSYISRTIIDGRNRNSTVQIIEGMDSTIVLNGFTITNGSSTDGAGIYCFRSHPRLENLIIKNNRANSRFGDGGGISLIVSSANLKNVKIIGNEANASGGGIVIEHGKPRFQNVTITNSRAGIHSGCLYVENAAPIFDSKHRSNIYLNFASNGDEIDQINSLLMRTRYLMIF